ncbi:MAG: hypothetical protein CVV37_03065 [Nitrospira bacterium HGW-Nitrospira-1]|nr:MAG: hypothetical protein CVV37_03065 [Nitrospira bacterium HGW-Nitrospira-1]
MSIKEIEKLREKVEKDPNSKLYVLLAEEYRKEGMLDEALEVLRKGIETQPGYMSARVSLGKIYLEKGQKDKARVEFESVIKAIPDNLYAHKKLAEIYGDTGERRLATKAYRTFLKLNPMDEEAANKLRELEGADTEQPVEKIEEHSAPAREEAAVVEEAYSEAMDLGYTSCEQAQGESVESGEEIDAFKKSLFGDKAEAVAEIPGESFVPKEDTEEGEELEEDEGEEEELFFGDMADVVETELLKTDEETKTISESEEIFGAEAAPEAAFESLKDNSELLQTADRLISEENYIGALYAYQQILTVAPGDKKTLQRIEELKALLRLMGKDEKVLLSQLSAFLSAIKKKGDEFPESA